MPSPHESSFPNMLQNFADVLEHISDGFFALDLEWKFLFVNRHAGKLLQKPVGELLGRSIWDVFPEAIGSVFQIEYEKAVHEYKPVSFEAFYPPIHSWLQISAHPSSSGLAVYFRDVSERRQSQEALLASESRFTNMVENLPAGAVFREGENLWLNRAAQRLTGYSQQEIRTLDDWFSKLYLEDPAESRSRYDQLRAAGIPDPVLCSLTRKDGSLRHIEFSGFLNENDEFWILNDITNRLLTEEKFRVLFDHSNTPYFLFDQEQVSDCNSAALKQLGLSEKSEAIGRSFSSFSPEYQKDGTLSIVKLNAVNHELDTVGQCSFEWTHRRADGSETQVFVSASKLLVGGKSMELVVWQDLTFIRLAEERLKESEARYRTIVENTDEIIYTLSLEGRFTFVSPSWTRHLGHSIDEVIGHRFIEFVHPDDRARGTEYTRRLFRDPAFRGSCVYRVFHTDGTIHWHETSGSVVFDEQGKPTHFVGLSHDVSEKLMAQEALEEARDAAVASSRAKSQFLATVSHEIRTPLNGVFGMTNLLAETPLTSTQMGYVRTIQASGEILRRVIDDVLDFSSIEAGKLTIAPLAIDVISALHDIVSLFQGAAHEKGIALGIDCDGMTSLQVYADPARVKQVVANLVSNAVKFTEVGGVKVQVRLVRETHTALILRIEVIDSGIGIRPDRAEAIFEGFTQADNSMHRRYGGSGLGLTISQRLTDLMGGTIGVESHYGSGSLFWVELPLSKITKAISKGLQSPPNVSLEGMRVLLAEDNLINVEVAKIQIEMLGCVVDVANNGRQAVQMFENHPYDVVLMDIQMPEMDGLQATRSIRTREIPTGSHIPIVALTATAFAEDKKACQDAGMDDFLSKPFKREDLEKMLKTWAPVKTSGNSNSGE